MFSMQASIRVFNYMLMINHRAVRHAFLLPVHAFIPISANGVCPYVLGIRRSGEQIRSRARQYCQIYPNWCEAALAGFSAYQSFIQEHGICIGLSGENDRFTCAA